MLPSLKPWPYHSRPQLAKRYLDSPGLTGQTAITLFGGRGIGKTEFLRRDFEPLAIKQGWRVVHADLQSNPEQPVHALIAALSAPQVSRSGAWHSLEVPRLERIDFGPTGLRASIQRVKPADSTDTLEQLRKAFDKLKPSIKRPVCLVIDEVQILAHPKHEALIAALRASIQRHDQGLLRVFTGSTRLGLERAFLRAKAPLFGQGGTQEQFPELGQGFIDEVCHWFKNQTGGVSLDPMLTMNAFVRLKHSARMLRTAVEMMLLGQVRSMADAVAFLEAASPDIVQMQKLIAELGDLERAVLRAIYLETTGLYSEEFLRNLARELKAKVSVPMVLNAIRGLERRQWIQQHGRGRYVLENAEIETAYERWLETQAPVSIPRKTPRPATRPLARQALRR
jgi:hypothetical protein